ncbi:hypothetical protein QTI66_39040 [Variovorax sp. J22R133]|uniref:hypothetical protein n=1 Tax=Variovorax brevis TaxID=3053503 RepID=UPI002578F078|nr:hypothetical protein [Variovorax sp. J22R133]MDM0118071.1 hypothetical protein [Variovorax sp. J22R133]
MDRVEAVVAAERFDDAFTGGAVASCIWFANSWAARPCCAVQLLAIGVRNQLDRYLNNSPMLPELKRDADGGITSCIQVRLAWPAQGIELTPRRKERARRCHLRA